MNKEIAKKWVEALRSGEYRQAKSVLRSTSNGFCCLGVLCNLHAQAHPSYAEKQPLSGIYGGKEDFPPLAVLDWAGLRSQNGTYGHASALSIDNDKGYTFSQIAKTIEEHVEAL